MPRMLACTDAGVRVWNADGLFDRADPGMAIPYDRHPTAWAALKLGLYLAYKIIEDKS